MPVTVSIFLCTEMRFSCNVYNNVKILCHAFSQLILFISCCLLVFSCALILFCFCVKYIRVLKSWAMRSASRYLSFQVRTVQAAQSMPTSSPAQLAPTTTWHWPMTCMTVCHVLVRLYLCLGCFIPMLQWSLQWEITPPLRTLFLKPSPPYFHGNEPLTKDHPFFKTPFSETFSPILPWKWTPDQGPPLL